MNNDTNTLQSCSNLCLFWFSHSVLSAPQSSFSHWASHSGGRQKLQSKSALEQVETQEREITMQEGGERARLPMKGYTRRFEGGFNGSSKEWGWQKVRKRLMAYNWWWGGTCEVELRSHTSVMLTSQPWGAWWEDRRGERKKRLEEEVTGTHGAHGEENVSGYISF